MIDLHTHSTASDGNKSPKDLISYAASKNISVIALTDHDTISGLKEAKEEAEKLNITFIPGIELNINWNKGEFHLLGLGLTSCSPLLKDIIQKLQAGRDIRNLEIINNMKKANFDVSMEELKDFFPDSILGRPHIAKYLVEKKICKTMQQSFDKYLGKGRPFYVNRIGADLDEAIVAITESGGIPILAHPLSLYLSWGKMEPILQNLKERGIEGLEAFHSGVKKNEALRLEELARKIGVFVTGGSDFHGEHIRKDRKIGYACGGEKIPERLWTEELEPQLKRINFLQQ